VGEVNNWDRNGPYCSDYAEPEYRHRPRHWTWIAVAGWLFCVLMFAAILLGVWAALRVDWQVEPGRADGPALETVW
jgi:hypothetical protein